MPILQKTIAEQDTDTVVIVVASDVTARKLTFRAKRNNNDDATVLIQKLNQVAGATDDTDLYAETLGTTPEKTKITVYLDTSDTNQAYPRLYFYVESEDPDDNTDVDVIAVGAILLTERTGAIPTGNAYIKSTLTLTKYAHWKMVAGVITIKAMLGWTNNPEATIAGSTVSIASSGSEIPAGTKFESTNEDYDTGAWTAALREIYYNDVSQTTEFWLEYYQ